MSVKKSVLAFLSLLDWKLHEDKCLVCLSFEDMSGNPRDRPFVEEHPQTPTPPNLNGTAFVNGPWKPCVRLRNDRLIDLIQCWYFVAAVFKDKPSRKLTHYTLNLSEVPQKRVTEKPIPRVTLTHPDPPASPEFSTFYL